jgi:hypothetical protein
VEVILSDPSDNKEAVKDEDIKKLNGVGTGRK